MLDRMMAPKLSLSSSSESVNLVAYMAIGTSQVQPSEGLLGGQWPYFPGDLGNHKVHGKWRPEHVQM